MQVNSIIQNFYDSSFTTSYYYDSILSLKSVLIVSSEYFLATSILTIALFFVLLPKLPLRYSNNKVYIFSFINYQLNFLAILILFFYCFLCVKQYFLFLFEISTFNNSIFNDFTSLFAKLIIGFSSIVYLLFIQDYLIDQKLNYFEYYILILTSILGFCLLCCSNDLLTAYLAIELQGLSFYVLSSFKKSSNYSAESGVKYFIIGSFSTIIFLLGTNLIYGISGSIYIFDFKDLFVWVFSINSFFLSFDYLPKALEFFQVEKSFNNQEYNSFNNSFFLMNLKTIFNNFLILKNKVFISLSDSFYFMHDVTQQINYVEECLLENILVQMTNTSEKITDSSTISIFSKSSIFQLLFSEPKELIISSMFQNLVNWFLLDIQNHGIKFNEYDSFSESLLLINSEVELLNKFKYNWIGAIEMGNQISVLFSQFNDILTQSDFINDWSEYLAFRHLSESIDMALTSDIFSNFDFKKAGAPEVFNKSFINSKDSFNNNNKNFLLILKKFSEFGYISLKDSKFILNNINKIFENFHILSDLNLIFSSVKNFQNYEDLSMFKYFLFSSVSDYEYNFYEKLSNFMIQYSSSLNNFNGFLTDCSMQNSLFDSRAQRLLSNTLIENKQFLNDYFITLNKINSYFISVEDKWNYFNNHVRVIESIVQNHDLNYYNKRISIPLFYLEYYYFNNIELEFNDFNNIELEFDDFSAFSKFCADMLKNKQLQISNKTYELIFKPNSFLKYYNCEEFFHLFSSFVNPKEINESFSWYFLYYLVYSDSYSRNVQLLHYLFDVITNLFRFIEHEDFFENSKLNTEVIVSDYEKFLVVDKSLEEIDERFKLLKEKSTLSISEVRLLISQIMNILKSTSYDSNKMKLLTNIAYHMESNFSQDNPLFWDRVVKLKNTKVFPFLLSEINFIVNKLSEMVLQFYENNVDTNFNIFLLNSYIEPLLIIQRLFSTNLFFFLPYKIFNFLEFNNIVNVSQFKDIDCDKEFKEFLDNLVIFPTSFLILDSDFQKLNIINLTSEKLKMLSTIANYALFYTQPDTNSEGLIILPKDLNYAQRIKFLDFIIFKIKLFKHNFRPTRWEFEFLLNELGNSLINVKDNVLKEKYREIFSSLKSILSVYLNNSNRLIKTDIFNNPKDYQHLYDARQTTWFFESLLDNLSVKELLFCSNKNCEILSKCLNDLFIKENIVKNFNNNTNFLENKNFSLILCNSFSEIYSISLLQILNLFPLFLDLSENPSFNSNFMFDTFLIELGLLLILISLFLKLALTPFHLWSPDIYEGSPSSTTFFFVVISKISIFMFLLKICYLSFYSMIIHWQFYSLFVAILSILLGSIAALKQRKIKSLLAYSSISNMGLILAAFSVGNFEGIKAVFYYFTIYIISGLSIWLIFLGLKLRKKKITEKYNKDLGDFSLLHESNSLLAYAFVITIFTIAGIPPMVGFLAKISIFLSLILSSMIFVAFISILVSVISTFYYIRILKVVFFENVLVGKLFYPFNSKINLVSSFLFFLLIFLFINPLSLDFFTYKIVLFLSKSFY